MPVLTMTQECLEGRYLSNEDCPLARAINPLLKPNYVINVGGFEFDIYDRENRYERLYRYNFSKTVKRQADKFLYKTAEVGTKMRVAIPRKFLKEAIAD